jgi:hypothetical protein
MLFFFLPIQPKQQPSSESTVDTIEWFWTFMIVAKNGRRSLYYRCVGSQGTLRPRPTGLNWITIGVLKPEVTFSVVTWLEASNLYFHALPSVPATLVAAHRVGSTLARAGTRSGRRLCQAVPSELLVPGLAISVNVSAGLTNRE